MDWRDDAACVRFDPELWFPMALEQGATGGDHWAAQAAVAVCRGCPVAAECLRWAVDTGQSHGIWGGRTPAERAGAVAVAPVTLPKPGTGRGGGSKLWSEADDQDLMDLDRLGLRHEQIARRLGRTRKAVTARVHRLRAEAPV